MKNKKILITGGAGYLGKALISKFYKDNEITIYSRDEAKHYYLLKQYPKLKCIIGDVACRDMLIKAGKNHDIGIFAASLKQIEAVDQNYEIAERTIINGAFNSRACAEYNNFESACFISSDKSRAATTLYGAMKFVAGESFIVNENLTNTKLSTAIYGNVMNSTGSVIPLMWDAIVNNYALTLYSPEMTRFMLTIDEAVSLIEAALQTSGYNIIPVAKSFNIKDLFEIFASEFNLRYNISTPRISEKIHEIMISGEEAPRVFKTNNNLYFKMHYKKINDKPELTKEYSSRDNVITKDALYKFLKDNNFYKPHKG